MAKSDEAETRIVEPPQDDEQPAWEGSLSATEPIVSPDGHVVLSKEDLDARKKAGL